MTKLTGRQKEIAELVAQGLSTKAIAAAAGISERTAEVHIAQAAARIGGDTPPKHRLMLWFFSLKKEPDAV